MGTCQVFEVFKLYGHEDLWGGVLISTLALEPPPTPRTEPQLENLHFDLFPQVMLRQVARGGHFQEHRCRAYQPFKGSETFPNRRGSC